MSVVMVKKVEYKIKNVSFEDGILIDNETGEEISFMENLKRVFGEGREFTISASLQNKTEHEPEDFAE